MNLDISHEFDSCVILSYYSGDNLKKNQQWVFIVTIHITDEVNIWNDPIHK